MMAAARESANRTAISWIFRPQITATVLAAIFAVYFALLHPWYMNWGATAAEQHLPLPGDERSANTANYFTRAITIDAPVERVWPWLLQIGQDRAGFYSNDFLENLFGGDIHNSSEIRPEWQIRAVGDKVPMAPLTLLGGALGDAPLLTVRAMEPYRMIADVPGRFVVERVDAKTTRLLLREPIPELTGSPVERFVVGTITKLVWDPMHFVMEQRMLRGIKERAEGRPLTPPAVETAAQIGWALAGIGIAALYVLRRKHVWLALPAAVVAPGLVWTSDGSAALAGFLALAISLYGAFVLGRRWLAPFSLLAAGVLLILLLAPDAYTALGLILGAAAVVVSGVGAWSRSAAV